MSTRDEQDEEYSVKSKRKKKTLTKENCLFHYRDDCGFNDIVKFSETSWTVSLQLVLKACVKRNFCLIRYLLKESHNSQLHYFISFRMQRKASEFRQDNIFSTEVLPAGSCGYHKRFYHSYTNSKALMKFRPPITPDTESKRSSTRFT